MSRPAASTSAPRRKSTNSSINLARQGVAILFASSEMEEVLGLADRALVMHEGRIAGELSRAELTEEAVMRLATGEADRQPERIGA